MMEAPGGDCAGRNGTGEDGERARMNRKEIGHW
jgi:hypothetical protein